jgi:GNAT superfamily N-acetyltransferase
MEVVRVETHDQKINFITLLKRNFKNVPSDEVMLSYISSYISNHHHYLVVLDDTCIGTFSLDKHVLLNVCIDLPYQRKGYGRQLIDFAMKLSDTNYLLLNSVTEEVLPFYKKLIKGGKDIRV